MGTRLLFEEDSLKLDFFFLVEANVKDSTFQGKDPSNLDADDL